MLEELFSSSLPIVITTLGGVFVYAVQRTIDRRHVLAATRRDFYSEFLDTWLTRHIAGRSTPGTEAQYSRLRLRLYVVSSDEVIRAFYKVSEYLDRAGNRPIAEDEASVLKHLLAALILAMRKDCYERGKLNPDEVAKYMPVGGARRTDANDGRQG